MPKRRRKAFKVVKKQRGAMGQWFAYPAALTTDSEAEANAYAQSFAERQRGIGGTRIVVMTGGGKFVREFKT